MHNTSTLAEGWARQHQVYPEGQWVKGYWDSAKEPYRDQIVRALEHLGPFQSVLEIGCNTGPNLKRIHERWPQVRLIGLDVNEEALLYGTEKAKEEGWFWLGLNGTFDYFTQAIPPPVDIILSCYTLTYADPQTIDLLLARALACARVGLVIAEPMVGEGEPDRWIPQGPSNIQEYLYDYRTRFEGYKVTEFPVVPPVQRLQIILTITK